MPSGYMPIVKLLPFQIPVSFTYFGYEGVFRTFTDATVDLDTMQRNGEGGVWEHSVAGAAGPWGHICVLCSLSGNILI